MTPVRSPFLVALLPIVASLSVSRPALAAGGEVKLVTDDTYDGFSYCGASPAGGPAFSTEYRPSDFDDLTAVLCGARVRELNASGGTFTGTLRGELRLEDALNPGYPDLGGSGLHAPADPSSEGACGDDAGTPRFWTFGGGAGVPRPSSTFFLVAIDPPHGSNPADCCSLLLDTDGPVSGRCRPTAFNHFLEVVALERLDVDLTIRAAGARRFPGDRGAPVVFTRRPNAGPTVTDDELTLTLVIDNRLPGSATRRIDVCADKGAINPAKDFVDAARFFTPAISNPMTLPAGRTRITTAITRPALKSKIANVVDSRVTVNLPLFAAVDGVATSDPCSLESSPETGADSESTLVGLRRRAGRHDDGGAEAVVLLDDPILPGDSLNERFKAIDLPKVPFSVTGLEFVGTDFAAGHPGLDALELRTEDPAFSGSPDPSPGGLLAACGTRDFVGEISASSPGGAPVTVTCDVADVPLVPPIGNLFVVAWLGPGGSGAGTTWVGFDTSSAATVLGDASGTSGGTSPATPLPGGNFLLGMRLDGDGGTLESRAPSEASPVPPARVLTRNVLLDAAGRPVR